MNLYDPTKLDVTFEFDAFAAKRYSEADRLGRRAALNVSGKGNSASVAYKAAYEAYLDESFEMVPRNAWKAA